MTFVLLQISENYQQKVDISLMLMQRGIISVKEWDHQISMFLKESLHRIGDKELQFVAQLLEEGVQSRKILSYKQVPSLVLVISQFRQDKRVAHIFGNILKDFEQQRPQQTSSSSLKHLLEEFMSLS